MTHIIKINNNKAGIVQYCQVDKDGKPDKDGDYIYVKNAYINPKYRCIRYLRYLIREASKSLNAKYVYFKRKKYKDRLSPLYNLSLTRRV